MASISACFVIRSSKLPLKTISLSTTRQRSTQYPISIFLSSQRAPLSSSACILAKHESFTSKTHYSTSVSTCTTQLSYQNSDLQGRLRSNPRSSTSTTFKTFSSYLTSRRFASSKSSTSEETKQAGPLTPSKIAAPAILQKALNPTPHENIYTIPNILTFSRLLSAPAIGYFILHSQPVTALALFAYAGITDLVDGYLARRYNSQTVVGTILDPMADKTLMTIAVITLGIQGLIPIWLAVIILGRDVGLAISACYYRYISLPPPKTFMRYWDFSLPSAEVRPTEISKINTLLQLLLVGNAMVLPVLPVAWVEAWNLVGVFEGWSFLVAGTTVWSGLSYVFSNDAVKILSVEESRAQQLQLQEQQQENKKKMEKGNDDGGKL